MPSTGRSRLRAPPRSAGAVLLRAPPRSAGAVLLRAPPRAPRALTRCCASASCKLSCGSPGILRRADTVRSPSVLSGAFAWVQVMERLFLVLCGLNGFLAVALGAFGAHGLRARIGPLADGAQRLAWWDTAAHYHLMHALALGLVAQLAARSASGAVQVAGFA